MTMGTRWGFTAALVVGLVSCTSANPRQDAPTASPIGSSPPPAMERLSPSPSASGSPSPSIGLAELLPTSLNGVELHSFAVGGDILKRLAAALGVPPTAVEAAYASEHGARFFQSYALRVAGVDGQHLLDAFSASAYDPTEGDVTRDEATVGGRPVTVVTQASTAARLGTFYAYLVDDVLLVVQSFDPVVADEVIAALP